ncbi:MAG: protein jag [Clostridia bacterium]|nr:protein jag [Clostridia bacterium]
MRSYEASAKNVEEAISAGLEQLGVSIGDVTIEILQEGSKGLFGLFGSRMAKVRLTVKEEEEDPLASLTASKPAKPARAEKREPKPEKKEAPKAEKKEAPKAEKKEAAKPEKKEQKKEATKSERKPAPKAEKKEAPKAPAAPVEMAPQADPETAAGKAQQFLQTLTQMMGVNVSVAVSTDENGNVLVNMTGDTLGILIGRRGETLDALQYLTSLRVNKGQEGYTRVTLDTENYRAKREEALTRLANRMANRAVKTGRKVSLEPMNPYERRILHSALQANDAVDTHSEGEEPNRHVVITLKKPAKKAAPKQQEAPKQEEATEE